MAQLWYLPLLPGPYKAGSRDKSELWMQEGAVCCLTHDDVVEGIYSGQYESPARVLEIDETAGTARDVTEIIAGWVGELSWSKNEPPHDELRNWLERHHAPYCCEGAE